MKTISNHAKEQLTAGNLSSALGCGRPAPSTLR